MSKPTAKFTITRYTDIKRNPQKTFFLGIFSHIKVIVIAC